MQANGVNKTTMNEPQSFCTLEECVKESSVQSYNVQRRCFMNYSERVQANTNNYRVVVLNDSKKRTQRTSYICSSQSTQITLNCTSYQHIRFNWTVLEYCLSTFVGVEIRNNFCNLKGPTAMNFFRNSELNGADRGSVIAAFGTCVIFHNVCLE
jgi:hypothetical protein